MKSTILILLFLSGIIRTNAQQQNFTDSLRAIINQQKNDTEEVNALTHLGNQQTLSDSGLLYAQKGLSLAKKLNYKKGEADCLWVLGLFYTNHGNFGQGIQYFSDALNIYEDLKDDVGTASAHLLLQGTYRTMKDYRASLAHSIEGEQIAESKNIIGKFAFPGHRLAPLFLAEIGQTYVLMNQMDSALFYTQKSIDQYELFNGAEWNFPVYVLATIQYAKGNHNGALRNYRRALPLAIENDFFRDTLQIFSGMSTLFKKTNKLDSAIYYAQLVVRSKDPEMELNHLLEAVTNLGQSYKLKGDKDSAIKYIELRQRLEDSIFSKEKDRQVQRVAFNERLKEQEIALAQNKYKSKIQLFALVAGLLVLLLVAIILWRSNRHKQKAKIRIENAYDQLKSTQTQLIQSEKMASLGELTAGIAHEIQNPLNFVNNFADVNRELLVEMRQEMSKQNYNEANELAKDIEDNERKINEHGKRAESIVKGMLLHARSTSGTKEPTDINKQVDEFLRLSYHGFRAKDKAFNAVMETDFDQSVGNINVVPQEIGRVLLNLFNNAFYAVDEKKKQQPKNEYAPIVFVTTKRTNDKVLVSVKDNGNGIPKKILDKIFQPFFTSKPTGQGTGLGLSLAYDIIKAHGGEIKVNTKEGEGVEFKIQLPIT